ncbi:MAG: glycoside hydrolase family 130 protein [Planctomycetota bacterium]
MTENDLTTADCIRRYPGNPILAAKDIPYKATLVNNAAVCKFQGRYVMLFENDYGDAEKRKLDGCNVGLAVSRDGFRWTPEPHPLNADPRHPLHGIRDPRMTVLDGRCYVTYWTFPARRGICGGLAVTDDLDHWEVLSLSAPDNRNMVIFPERIDGKLLRLERPFASNCRPPGDRYDIWMSASADGRYWGETRLLLTCDEVPWCNDKIGPAAPPVKTPKGWLTLFHAVDVDPSRKLGWYGDWNKRYTVGVMLLDLRDPARVIGLSRKPIIVPDPCHPYEMEGYRGNVIFPCGMILEDDGGIKIYYGASDTVEALATSHVDDLLVLCDPR